MSDRRTLTIDNWTGSGTGSITLRIGSYVLIERDFGKTKILKLIVYRKPDQYSSRLGMMANLNKKSRSLSWGFQEMTLRVEKSSDQGTFISLKTMYFTGIGVEDSKTVCDEEEVTFVFTKMSQYCLGQC